MQRPTESVIRNLNITTSRNIITAGVMQCMCFLLPAQGMKRRGKLSSTQCPI